MQYVKNLNDYEKYFVEYQTDSDLIDKIKSQFNFQVNIFNQQFFVLKMFETKSSNYFVSCLEIRNRKSCPKTRGS